VKIASLAMILMVSAPVAEAGSLTDADPTARCTQGAAYARRGDLSRAALYLDGCEDAKLPEDIGRDIRRAAADTRKRVEASQLSRVVIDSDPTGLTVEIDALAGESFATPKTIWVKAGRYTLKGAHDGRVYSTVVAVDAHSRTTAVLDLGMARKPVVTAPADKKLDFTDDPGAMTQKSGPPPDVKHPSLVKGKFAGEVASIVEEDHLDDPLAIHASRRPWRTTWLGLRVGGGMFDDGAASARAGMAVAATGRMQLESDCHLFMAGRLDWSRRGGDTGIDVIGASAGMGYALTQDIAVIGQLRGDLRLAGTRAMDDVGRVGASLAVGAEVALPGSPITAGVRFEQGLTTMVADTRDRAVLLELGVDWR
jgi:hypothetical protein